MFIVSFLIMILLHQSLITTQLYSEIFKNIIIFALRKLSNKKWIQYLHYS